MKKHYILFLFTIYIFNITAFNQDLNYYFPDNIRFDVDIPRPASVIGHEVGEWHVTHDRLVHYMRVLAKKSERVEIIEYGKTYEGRPLLLLTISAPENIRNIEEIRKTHLLLSNPNQSNMLNTEEMPVFAWMGYSVHGNEPSGGNASLLMAYYLAAAQSDSLNIMLRQTVVLIDPCFNPDGFNRFANWVNTKKSKNPNADPDDIEHLEPWPGSRTNHYWFDLNRDWLPAQHPESRARLQQFHRWKPNVLTDHHEMGTNSTFFFQPGIAERVHPLTPDENQRITMQIATYHAKALDDIGTLYFTRERFDDFYFGKGSTYPDINGAIGILFEQASSRGHIKESIHGRIDFPYTIKNQLITSLSTLKASYKLKNQLLNYQRKFYHDAIKKANQDEVKAYIMQSSEDPARLYHLMEIVQRHQINAYQLSKELNINNTKYKSNQAVIIPTNQHNYNLIKALFGKWTSFSDSLFYDVSAWDLASAFNIKVEPLSAKQFTDEILGSKLDPAPFKKGKTIVGKSNYAYVIGWDNYYAPKVLNELLRHDVITKAANKPFITEQGKKFSRGTLLVPVAYQTMHPDTLYQVLSGISTQTGVDVTALKSGLMKKGADLGSDRFSSLKAPKIALLVGNGINSNEAGEVWHLLDHRFDIPLTLLPQNRVNRLNINKYNTIIFVSGRYHELSNRDIQYLDQWIKDGGNAIAIADGIRWLKQKHIIDIDLFRHTRDTISKYKYADMRKVTGARLIKGAVFKAKIDLTHPVGYGFQDKQIMSFKNNRIFLEPSKNPFTNPVFYTEKPLVNGYISKSGANIIGERPVIEIIHKGRGTVICLSDNPNFRGFWYGTNKLFLNSIFFGPIIRNANVYE